MNDLADAEEDDDDVGARDATRDRIFIAAEKLFAINGFAEVSVRDITTAAGVNLAAVNYHFGSKDALLFEIFRTRTRELNRARARLLHEAEDAPGDTPRLRNILFALVAPLALLPQPAGATGPAAAAVSPQPQQLVQRPDGFPLTPVVGLVRTARSDADAERVVRQALNRAGVTNIRTTNGSDPGTPTTIWLGRDPSVLRALRVADSTGLPVCEKLLKYSAFQPEPAMLTASSITMCSRPVPENW